MSRTNDQVIPIRKFGGVNRLDTAEPAALNQFQSLTNVYQAVRDRFYRRYGSTYDLQAADLYGASHVDGVHRFRDPDGVYHTLYSCVPDSTTLPQPTTDLTLTEINGGDLFAGGAVETMRFCYTWVGLGRESNFNTRTRGGYDPTKALAHQQPGHQSITVSANTKGVRVTAPAFPSGVRSANIFAARGSMQMTYVGSVTTSGGTLDVTKYIGSYAAAGDPIYSLSLASTGGSLEPGTYYVAAGYLASTDCPEGTRGDLVNNERITISKFESITLEPGDGGIVVSAKAQSGSVTSTNGAKAAYVFISRCESDEFPMVFAGFVKTDDSDALTISSMPSGTNAHTTSGQKGASSIEFFQGVLSENAVYADTTGFILAKQGATVREILPSRSDYIRITEQSASVSLIPIGHIRTPNDSNQTLGDWETYAQSRYFEPSFVSHSGRVFMANGLNDLIHLNADAVGFAQEKSGTATLPPYPGVIKEFKQQLVAAGGACKNIVYASNAAQPYNWAAGGTGTAPKFVTIGSGFEDHVSSMGIFSYTTGTSGPASYLVFGKKSSAWTLSNIPDPVSGVSGNPDQLSGQVGCIAPRTMVSTPIGLVFLGSDGDIYLSRGSGEPKSIGAGIKPILEHLADDEELMRKCSAVFHQNQYKLFFPETSSSTGCDAQLWADLRISDGRGIIFSGPHRGIGCDAQMVLSGDADSGVRLGTVSGTKATAVLDDVSTFADLGTVTEPVIEGKQLRFGAEMHLKRFMGMMLDAYYDTQFDHSLSLEFFCENDYALSEKTLSEGGAVWDSSNWDSGLWSSADFQAIPCLLGSTNLMGRTLRWKLTYTGDAQFILAAVGIIYKPERRIITP